jgi:hypothetical protein
MRLFTKPCASFSFSSDPWSFFAAKHPLAGISFIPHAGEGMKSPAETDNATWVEDSGDQESHVSARLSILVNGGAFFTI